MRADARRNREAVMDAARDLLAALGPDVSMEAIASAAGVGVGTLYRHFADRRALIRAVVFDRLAYLTARAQEADALFDDDPAAAWDTFFVDFVASGIPLLLPSLLPMVASGEVFSEDVLAARNEIVSRASHIVGRAQEAGLVRTDVSVAEIATFTASAMRPLPGVPDVIHARLVERRVPLLKAAFAPSDTPLPAAPVTPHEIFSLIDPVASE
jgi:AcrR family transcriptional regulator